MRILSLLVVIQVLNVVWLAFCVYVFSAAGPSVIFLLTFEVCACVRVCVVCMIVCGCGCVGVGVWVWVWV